MNNKIPAPIKAFMFFLLLLGVTLPLCAHKAMDESTAYFLTFIIYLFYAGIPFALCVFPAAVIKWNILQWLTPINDPSEEIRFKPVLRRTIYEILYLLFVMGITFFSYELSIRQPNPFLIIAVVYLLFCLPVSLIVNFRFIGKCAQGLSRFKKILMTFLFSILLPVLFALAFLLMSFFTGMHIL